MKVRSYVDTIYEFNKNSYGTVIGKKLKMSLYNFERSVFITPDDKRDLPRILPQQHDKSLFIITIRLFLTEKLERLHFF